VLRADLLSGCFHNTRDIGVVDVVCVHAGGPSHKFWSEALGKTLCLVWTKVTSQDVT
jgi:uncharacterized YccA/Bax inhibitor family protein